MLTTFVCCVLGGVMIYGRIRPYLRSAHIV